MRSFVLCALYRHPLIFDCTRLPRWVKDKRLSFIPPDGRFTLMEYRYSGSANETAAQIRPLPVPFHLSTSIPLQDNGGI